MALETSWIDFFKNDQYVSGFLVCKYGIKNPLKIQKEVPKYPMTNSYALQYKVVNIEPPKKSTNGPEEDRGFVCGVEAWG